MRIAWGVVDGAEARAYRRPQAASGWLCGALSGNGNGVDLEVSGHEEGKRSTSRQRRDQRQKEKEENRDGKARVMQVDDMDTGMDLDLH